MIETEVRQSLKAHVRWMVRRDMPDVLDIESASYDFPMCEEEVLEALRRRNCIGMVAEREDRILGFMIYELRRECIRIIDLAVHTESRRLRVGEQMVNKLKTKLTPERRTRLELVARETNIDGLLFLKNQGFRATKVLRGEFDDGREDGYEIVYDL